MSLVQQQVSIRHCIKRRSALALALIALLSAITVAAQAQTVTTVYNFVSTDNSVQPVGPIAEGRDGNYYGITVGPGVGTIYSVSPSGAFTLLHTFASDGSEGQSCNGLILGTDGNFYGTCEHGGNNSNSTGTFFKVTPTGTLTVLHDFDGTFSGTVDGCYPLGVPVQASDGNFYGTTFECGVNDAGLIYKITPAGVFTVVHAFAFGAADGNQPEGALIQGSDGNLWGTLSFGGANNGGAVFKSSLTGNEFLVFSFASCPATTTGCNPLAGLVQGTDGSYYGTTEMGGASNQGVAFKVTPTGTYTELHSFNLSTDNGAYPIEPLTLGTDGNFYGVATDCIGGGCSPSDIFEVTSKGVFTDVFNFSGTPIPGSPLLLSTLGSFYGITEEGGTSNAGMVYNLADKQTPFISPGQTSGKVGSKIGIIGQGFSSASVVKFGGTAATNATRAGSTFIQATVPAGALTGLITVTTGATTLSSLKPFKVLPRVISFSPPSGPVGTSVTITGTGFTQTTGVKFNGTMATFTVNSDTQITATVPAGATTGKIAVTTKGGSASSSTSFTVN